ncbi:hypothetical protein Nepgr_019969 [Nepenthes gracilis]|uniref:Uncharacterized protein n=1 Tax=Nepenthes gracilis TaxID=150966 RepID=A0AAD3SV30_NEPGR|nr:hypothetical protein Nepgr_019969 [Nepenthes gracilis]
MRLTVEGLDGGGIGEISCSEDAAFAQLIAAGVATEATAVDGRKREKGHTKRQSDDEFFPLAGRATKMHRAVGCANDFCVGSLPMPADDWLSHVVFIPVSQEIRIHRSEGKQPFIHTPKQGSLYT